MRLADVLAHSRRVLEGLTLAELEAKRESSRDGREYSVAWCLAHVLKHTALHLRHMQLKVSFGSNTEALPHRLQVLQCN